MSDRMVNLSGVTTALVTPFEGSGAVDYKTFEALIARQLDAGIDGLLVCGTTGEAPTVTMDERVRLLEVALRSADGKVPVLMGTGGNNTAAAIAATRAAAEAGAQVALVVTPFYLKTSQAGLIAHFEAIADESPIPVLLYNVPGRCGVDMLPETTAHLSCHEQIVGIKEASGTVDRFIILERDCAEGFTLLSGDDGLAAFQILAGAAGVISVASNVAPARFKSLIDTAAARDVEGLRKESKQLAEFLRLLTIEPNPIPVKALMADMGLLEKTYRLPLVNPGAQTQTLLDELRQNFELR